MTGGTSRVSVAGKDEVFLWHSPRGYHRAGSNEAQGSSYGVSDWMR